MVTGGQVLFAVTVGVAAAFASNALFHAARIALVNAFEQLAFEIDDALSVPLPDFLVDDEV